MDDIQKVNVDCLPSLFVDSVFLCVSFIPFGRGRIPSRYAHFVVPHSSRIDTSTPFTSRSYLLFFLAFFVSSSSSATKFHFFLCLRHAQRKSFHIPAHVVAARRQTDAVGYFRRNRFSRCLPLAVSAFVLGVCIARMRTGHWLRLNTKKNTNTKQHKIRAIKRDLI